MRSPDRRRFIYSAALGLMVPFVPKVVFAGPFLPHRRKAFRGGGGPAFYYTPGFSVSGGGSDYNHTNPNARLGKIVLIGGGTVTKLGIYISFVNASTAIKMCLFDASRAAIGSGVTNTIASGDAQWHDWAVSEAVSAGTFYVGYSSNVGFEGALQGKFSSQASGDSYETSAASTYANFPGSLTGLSSSSNSIGLRLELTP